MIRLAALPLLMGCQLGVQPAPWGVFAGPYAEIHEHARLSAGAALTDQRTGGRGDHRLGTYVDLAALASPLYLAARYQPPFGVTHDGLEPPDGGFSLVLALYLDI